MGFATLNDLERHQNSVHKLLTARRESVTFKCFGQNCNDPHKEWPPRLDNFRSHLSRKHKNEDHEELLRRSRDWYNRERRPRLSDFGTRSDKSAPSTTVLGVPSEDVPLHGQSPIHLSPAWEPSFKHSLTKQAGPTKKPRTSSFGASITCPSLNSLTRPPTSSNSQGLLSGSVNGRLMSVDQSSSTFQSSPTSSAPYYASPIARRRFASLTVPNPEIPSLSDLNETNLEPVPHSFDAPLADLAQIASNFDPDQRMGLDLPSENEQFPAAPEQKLPGLPRQASVSIQDIRALISRTSTGKGKEEDFILARVLEVLEATGIQSSRAETSYSSTLDPTVTSCSDSTEQRGRYPCPKQGCTKTARCLSALKKHMNRHERLYGCTFGDCDEKFGSKYDWKRHERSLHHQPECWKCAICPREACTDRESTLTNSQLFYKKKLYEEHLREEHKASSDIVREHVRMQRLGRDGLGRYWCGFCEKIIPLQKQGLEGSNERFDHIDQHFKQGLRIGSWVDLARNVAKSKCRKAKPGAEAESDEDVLGASGIGGCIGDEDHRTAGACSNLGTNVGARSERKRRYSPGSDISGLSDSGSTQRRHSTTSKASREINLWCCQCGDGPKMFAHGGKCVMCDHQRCSRCPVDRCCNPLDTSS
jgi:hypothetical protein